MAELVGALAAVLTAVAFLPQALLTFRTRDVSGVSFGMYAAFTTGVALWLVYGVLTGSWPLVINNAVVLTFASSILGMKLRYRGTS